MRRSRTLTGKLLATTTACVAGLALAHPSIAADQGKVFVTEGLVCERPSFVDAVVTLTQGGEDLKAAMAQVNAGAATPRCLAGRTVVARYVAKAQTFFVKDLAFHVHKVKVIGIGVDSPSGTAAPQPLDRPLTQYVFSIEKAPGI